MSCLAQLEQKGKLSGLLVLGKEVQVGEGKLGRVYYLSRCHCILMPEMAVVSGMEQ